MYSDINTLFEYESSPKNAFQRIRIKFRVLRMDTWYKQCASKNLRHNTQFRIDEAITLMKKCAMEIMLTQKCLETFIWNFSQLSYFKRVNQHQRFDGESIL